VAGFDFFRFRRAGYSPRTPAAALKAVGSGTLPAEYFVYASTSAKPLDEEPFDLEEIERVLARTDLNLQTSVLLKRVLGKLIGSREQEVALFGAEGINALETRALMRIEMLKSQRDREPRHEVRTRLAREYYEMAELQAGSGSVRAFYLREALESLRGGEEGQDIPVAEVPDSDIPGVPASDVLVADVQVSEVPVSDTPLAVDILVALGLHDQAHSLLEKARAEGGVLDDPSMLLMSARVAFHRRDFRGVADICRRLAASGADLGEGTARIVSFWAGRDE
jgi:hypothetical protein